MKKALTILAVVLLLGVGVLRGLYQWASRDIPPPDNSEFVVERPVVAPEDNAYTYFLQATNFLYSPTNCALMSDYLAGKPVDEAEIRELIEKNKECLALIKKGTECSICLTPPVEDFMMQFLYIQPWLGIGRLNAVYTRQTRLDGDDQTATESCIVGMNFGKLILQDAPSLIVYLVGMAILDTAVDQVLGVATDLRTPEEELIILAKALNQSVPLVSGLNKAMKGEYLYSTIAIDYFRESAENSGGLLGYDETPYLLKIFLKRFQRSTYFFQPNKSKKLFADLYRVMIENTPLIYSDMIFPEPVTDSGGVGQLLRPNGVSRILQALLEPSIQPVLAKKCDMESMVSGTRLVVACNRFEREEGRWPESLQELVPEYLDAVPLDPFDGEPFRYSAEKGLVYSVGKNLTDEGGSSMMPDGKVEGETGWRHKNAEDLVFEIKPR